MGPPSDGRRPFLRPQHGFSPLPGTHKVATFIRFCLTFSRYLIDSLSCRSDVVIMRDLQTLQADIHRLIGALQTHVASGAPSPSFDSKAIPVFPVPPELEDTRQDALDALEEAAALLRGPIPYLMDMTGPRVIIIHSSSTCHDVNTKMWSAK